MINNTLHVPSRYKFHQEFAGVITIYDFCTEYPNHYKKLQRTRIELEALEKRRALSTI